MLYCVPAWYNTTRPWFDVTEVFYQQSKRRSFDDSVYHIRLLQKGQESCCLVVLNYMPHLRHFLHEQRLSSVPVWSVFDVIQDVDSEQTAMPFDLDMFVWPEHAEFVYTPFLVIVYVLGEVYARVEFTQYGTIGYVDFVKNNGVTHRYVMDDRAFVSSVVVYDDNHTPVYQEYWNRHGQWQLREYLQGEQSVLVNPECYHKFKQVKYASIQDVIEERTAMYFADGTPQDTVIIASHAQHNAFLLNSCHNMKTVLSYFSDRYDMTQVAQLEKDVQKAHAIVTDTQDKEDLLRPLVYEAKVATIPPYDTRLRLGRSQRYKEQTVFILIEDIVGKQSVLDTLCQWVYASKWRRLVVATYQHELYDTLEHTMDQLRVLYGHGNKVYDETNIEDVVPYQVIDIYTDQDILPYLERARVVIDLETVPNLFLHIASLSAGVPQINTVQTSYVTHQKNGYVLNDYTELEEALLYFLDSLENWNHALVHTVSLLKDYTSGELMDKWKELLQ